MRNAALATWHSGYLSPIGSCRPQKEIRVCSDCTRFVKVLQTNPLSQDTFSGSQAL